MCEGGGGGGRGVSGTGGLYLNVLLTCSHATPSNKIIIATARVLPRATQRELFMLGTWPR